MKLVYMYIESFGCLQNKGFLFDTRYLVTFSKEAETVYLRIDDGDKSLNGILFGNSSICALVGENGAGKSTCLDALKTWFVNFDNNPGIIIWEQDKQLYFHTTLKNAILINSKLKIIEYEGENENLKIRSLNTVYFSDIFEIKKHAYNIIEDKDNENESNHIYSYVDISSSGLLNDFINDNNFATLKSNPLRALHAKDSLLQIKLTDAIKGKETRYPWKEIQGERVLTFDMRNFQHLQNHIRFSKNSAANLGWIKNNINSCKRKSRENNSEYIETIILEGLFVDYLENYFHFSDRGLNHKYTSENIDYLDEFVGGLFSDYINLKAEESFLQLVFKKEKEIIKNNMEQLLEKSSDDVMAKFLIQSFEKYLILYDEIIKKKWIIENSIVQEERSHNRLTVSVPDNEQVQGLYQAYLDTNPFHDILQFEWLMSSGENSLCLLFARLYDTLLGINDQNKKETSYLLLIDEIDSFYHPRWQQKIVFWITSFLNQVFPEYEFQILLTTHSPVILSDIPKNNIIFMANDDKKSDLTTNEHCETFAANISTLYYDAFFMHEGSIGEVAKQTVDMLYEIFSVQYGNNSYRIPKTEEDIFYNKKLVLDRLSSKLDRRYVEEAGININNVSIIVSKLIDIIGEEIWREQLRNLFNIYFTRDSTDINHILSSIKSLSSKERKKIIEEIMKYDSYQ